MRIIGGTARGLHLSPLGEGDAAAHLRPTSDRVRESIFNLLINGGYGNPLRGARVLDVFAGTGALGLEALSRGAASCMFVDTDAAAVKAIRAKTRLAPRSTKLARQTSGHPPETVTPPTTTATSRKPASAASSAKAGSSPGATDRNISKSLMTVPYPARPRLAISKLTKHHGKAALF